jgi:6-phosphogluconate dehydrogenase
MRRAGCLLMMCGLVLLPWLYVLATSLPATATASHWPVAWVGLDALEAAGLIATGVLAALDDRRHALTAAATATLLVVDAWFDTTTAAAGRDLATAVAMAVCVELPLAVLCAALAVRALRRAE